ncbi:membrane dipeptidase, partial [Mycobacterium avium subsp. hominissuis]|nr:membrane dipeptidase [Mycobacterium avium subsp. hominissuis]
PTTPTPSTAKSRYTRWGAIQWIPPETLLSLGEHLTERGWSDEDIRAVLGGNFYRVAQRAWQA